MKTSLETIRNGLTSQLADLDRDLQAAETQVSELKSTRRQVAAAIRALGGQGSDTAKPAPKKAQVRDAVRELLDQNGGAIDADDLEALVADKLASEQGCSAMGLALRMREVLAADDFTAESGRVHRSSPVRAPQNPASA
ncbi:hypothetical protein Mal64_35600 [Pseudobythopirellula maris]|uniref:Uncharacterized protein n=1 Tax=Pseudobythopirellula maris TaxID=2527991 RepID=A0A5C5ZIU1_9BACT|nr:hypothetical protein [Pseudobythopirellula maris]TWT86731.1 hypothetical protein Mal64_35600 [Pseudobythopirellula maris]